VYCHWRIFDEQTEVHRCRLTGAQVDPDCWAPATKLCAPRIVLRWRRKVLRTAQVPSELRRALTIELRIAVVPATPAERKRLRALRRSLTLAQQRVQRWRERAARIAETIDVVEEGKYPRKGGKRR